MMMNNVSVQSFKLVCASYEHIYVPIIMYCLRHTFPPQFLYGVRIEIGNKLKVKIGFFKCM